MRDKCIQEFRDLMRNHQRNRCALCGKPMIGSFSDKNRDAPSADHIRPVCKGGSSDWANIQIVHKRCNGQRSLMTLRTWRKRFRRKEWREMIAGRQSMFDVFPFFVNQPISHVLAQREH